MAIIGGIPHFQTYPNTWFLSEKMAVYQLDPIQPIHHCCDIFGGIVCSELQLFPYSYVWKKCEVWVVVEARVSLASAMALPTSHVFFGDHHSVYSLNMKMQPALRFPTSPLRQRCFSLGTSEASARGVSWRTCWVIKKLIKSLVQWVPLVRRDSLCPYIYIYMNYMNGKIEKDWKGIAVASSDP